MKKHHFLRLLALAAAFALAVFSAGCDSFGDDEEAGGEDTLYIYSWGDYLDEDVLTQFEEETGIHVVLDTYDTNESMYPRVKEGATTYDLICPSDYMIQKMEQNDLLQPLDWEQLPNAKEYIGSDYLKQAEAYDPGNSRRNYRTNVRCFMYKTSEWVSLGHPDKTADYLSCFILDRFPDAREYWQDQLNYIMVDEAQDCNTDDWNLIEKLGAKHRNIFVVGDPDQCIYEWRGAKPAKFVQFASDTDIVLDENYRSTPKILDIANCVIANNRNRIPKDLFTRRAEGPAVIHFHGRTEKEETDWIVARIRQLQAEGASLQDIAILYRSAYQSRAIEQALLSEQLAYVIWGGIRFFERREIKDTLAYLRLLANPDDDLSFLRIVNVPSRKLGRSFQDQVKAFAATDGTSLYRALQAHLAAFNKKAAEDFVRLIEEGRDLVDRISISDLMNRMLDASGLKRSIREDQDEDRLENLDELLRSVRFYEQAHEGEDPSLASWLQDIALYTNADYRKETRVVKLMTIHQAKGLEFPFVFIVGLSEGIFPNMRTIREYKKNGEEEERRLMYVAITRAEKALFLTESEGFNIATKMSKYPSRFLAEIKRNMVVVEGNIPEELWRGTKNLVHVLDEENFIPDVLGAAVAARGGADGFGVDRAAYNSPFQIGQTVSHAVFGEGTILSASDDFSTFRVQFADGSVRHLRASFLHLPDLPE